MCAIFIALIRHSPGLFLFWLIARLDLLAELPLPLSYQVFSFTRLQRHPVQWWIASCQTISEPAVQVGPSAFLLPSASRAKWQRREDRLRIRAMFYTRSDGREVFFVLLGRPLCCSESLKRGLICVLIRFLCLTSSRCDPRYINRLWTDDLLLAVVKNNNVKSTCDVKYLSIFDNKYFLLLLHYVSRPVLSTPLHSIFEYYLI